MWFCSFFSSSCYYTGLKDILLALTGVFYWKLHQRSKTHPRKLLQPATDGNNWFWRHEGELCIRCPCAKCHDSATCCLPHLSLFWSLLSSYAHPTDSLWSLPPSVLSVTSSRSACPVWCFTASYPEHRSGSCLPAFSLSHQACGT